ncbi:sporulation histidine kinase inhibitor Sda [Ornithinibacillus halotolerans]|uniref:Sporulation histidine kinase inhibitor Sda n=1 Tax=Ornithinibacillus halotolerans TaxID=1274357 RepID=A0A916RW59_9BACI|nr:sporulation histidine kinase inhibitor Sda [Ornithinibacillus halotolerans]GGA70635.1 hypothetical protein GCM10008025_13080 [Ornithinibacillus halotolerans]
MDTNLGNRTDSLKKLSDKQLQEAYNNAIVLDLDEDFIRMLKREMISRKLIESNTGIYWV